MDIVVYMDYVLVLGQRIERPARITRSRWLGYWGNLAKRDIK
jgi:hypothetical protein